MDNNNKIIKNCCKCKKADTEVNQPYCKSCRSELNREYREKMKAYHLYVITGNGGQILYIGKTKDIGTRTSLHINGHVQSTKYLFEQGLWEEIKVVNVETLCVDDIELRVLENELINLYKPICNKITNTNYLLKNERLFELITGLHSRSWEVYKRKKIAK